MAREMPALLHLVHPCLLVAVHVFSARVDVDLGGGDPVSNQPVGGLLTDFDDCLQDLLNDGIGLVDRHAFEDWV